MRPKDYRFAVGLANSMDWNMTVEDFAFNQLLEPRGCFVALDGDKPVGVATCISYGKVGWFGNLVVQEQHRGRNVGTQLVQYALDYLRGRGASSVGLYAYKHLVDFYRSIGFAKDVEFVVMKSNAVSSPQTNKPKPKAFKTQNLQAASKIDKDCFGASRSELIERILVNPKNVGFVSTKGSELAGFAAAKVFGQAAEIGPVVCKKSEHATATRLLRAVLVAVSGLEAYLYTAAYAKTLLETAADAGFVEQFRLTRMFCGPNIAKNCIYSAESLERG